MTAAADNVRVAAHAARVTDEAAVSLVHDLVATPSVSGNERAAAELFVQRATDFGFEAEIDEAGNAVAHRGSKGGQHIVLLGHIDTVPGLIPVRIEGGVLHGRGSVDAKGPLAASLTAAARAELPSDVQVTVVAAVGEETAESPGARFLRDRMRPDACFIGEPSGWDGIALGYKGRLLVRAVCERAGTHSAGAEASAGDHLLSWWSEVLIRAGGVHADADRVFDQVQASVRSLGSSNDGLNESASLEGGFRLPPGISPVEFAHELSEMADQGRIRVCFRGHEEAYVSDRSDAVVRALSTAIRETGAVPRPKVKSGTSDMNVVAPAWRCPIAAYGPGDSSLDHTPRERLELAEYVRSARILQRAIEHVSAELCRSRA